MSKIQIIQYMNYFYRLFKKKKWKSQLLSIENLEKSMHPNLQDRYLSNIYSGVAENIFIMYN